MKRSPILFLQVVIVLVGIGALAVLLLEPHLEGRNAHATLFEIYFKDPFLAYAYVASIPFFMALYQTFRILGYVGHDMVFSPATVSAVRTIRHCATAIIGFVAVGLVVIMLADSDDRAGGIVMGIVFIFGASVVVAAASIFERIFRDALALRSGKDLRSP